jgi:hypothetical protein
MARTWTRLALEVEQWGQLNRPTVRLRKFSKARVTPLSVTPEITPNSDHALPPGRFRRHRPRHRARKSNISRAARRRTGRRASRPTRAVARKASEVPPLVRTDLNRRSGRPSDAPNGEFPKSKDIQILPCRGALKRQTTFVAALRVDEVAAPCVV